MSGKISQYRYGTGHDTSEWHSSWQKGYVCSPESGLIVMDRDAGGFGELMARCGIPLSPLYVDTGRPGGRQYYYDGRLLLPADWPTQRSLYAPDGTQVGDVKSCGFVPCPGSVHPNGRLYRLGEGSARGFEHMPPFLAAYTQALIADQEGLGRHCSGVDRGASGSGRNNELYELKRRLFYDEMLDEDDPEMARRIHAANASFAEPLPDSEVEHTVLKIKGWRRHGHFNPAPMDYADDLDITADPEAGPEPEQPDLSRHVTAPQAARRPACGTR